MKLQCFKHAIEMLVYPSAGSFTRDLLPGGSYRTSHRVPGQTGLQAFVLAERQQLLLNKFPDLEFKIPLIVHRITTFAKQTP